MKTTIIFNLDVSIVEKLHSLENRSSFLNELLNNHFKTHEVKKVLIEEKKQELKELETEVEREDRKRLDIEAQKAEVKESGFTQEVINFFHANKSSFIKAKMENYELKFGKRIESSEFFKLERGALNFKPIFDNK